MRCPAGTPTVLFRHMPEASGKGCKASALETFFSRRDTLPGLFGNIIIIFGPLWALRACSMGLGDDICFFVVSIQWNPNDDYVPFYQLHLHNVEKKSHASGAEVTLWSSLKKIYGYIVGGMKDWNPGGPYTLHRGQQRNKTKSRYDRTLKWLDTYMLRPSSKENPLAM